MDTMDEFLGKDCGESNFRLRIVLACLITFGLKLNTAFCLNTSSHFLLLLTAQHQNTTMKEDIGQCLLVCLLIDTLEL